ncbi:MAG: SDR family oxidoreductase [Ignavibacteriae bacterium]|nr:MAG: SDR family oxidoreductase [Ignavibacteriota bacterium]
MKPWALILGASSGFGGATALELAKHGYNIFGVHLDRQITMPNVTSLIKKIEHLKQHAVFFNINAADSIKRNEVLDEMQERLNTYHDKGMIKVLMHSLAFGTLKPFIAKSQNNCISQAQVEMTMDVMANSLIYWTQGLVFRNLLADGGRIFALTSAGSHSVIPFYGAVSAAKAALESHIRQLAFELASMNVTANAIMAGVTDTPALAKIPGAKTMIDSTKLKNPRGRLTEPEDVAKAIAMLCSDGAGWISGNVLGVDGAEDIINFTGERATHSIK